MDAADFVLGRFSSDEREAVAEMLERACSAVRSACERGAAAAMNAFNPSGDER
jgi:PTH1 family peptidyl-tRNA hydrolase